jgi:DNA-binding HxlR family transcriptional regulator
LSSAEGRKRDRVSRSTAAAGSKCAIQSLLRRIGDAWSVLVIEKLDDSPGPVRFNELRRRVGDISQRMLTVTLRKLEREGLVSRKVVPGSPPGVVYGLSELGRSLAVPIRALVRWAFANLETVEAARRRYDLATTEREELSTTVARTSSAASTARRAR